MIDLRALERCVCEHDRSMHEKREASCKKCVCDLFVHKMGHPGNPVDKWEDVSAAE
jgi:hypothetical protein